MKNTVRNAKISIIIPIYNREKSLKKCLDSVIRQTYENLEIILVDDGSQDNSGIICDDYANTDKRILVIHQQNAGVSAARNAGLAMVTGDYIGWVDSDDWIEPDMYECMLKNAQEYKADIVVCSRMERYEDRSIFRGWQKTEILNKEQATQMLLNDECMQNYLWDKLFRNDLLADITFPVGRTYEDIAVMYKVFKRVERVVCLPQAKYNYRQHSGSIIADNSLRSKVNYYLAAKSRYDEMSKDWPQFEALLLEQCLMSAVGVWGVCFFNSMEERRTLSGQLQDMASFCKVHYKDVNSDVRFGMAGRMVMRLTPYAKWWAFALAGVVNWLYKLKHGRNL